MKKLMKMTMMDSYVDAYMMAGFILGCLATTLMVVACGWDGFAAGSLLTIVMIPIGSVAGVIRDFIEEKKEREAKRTARRERYYRIGD